MSDLGSADIRRVLRLRSFFQPYPHFRLKISQPKCGPILVRELRSNSLSHKKGYSVLISPRLLRSDSPDWVEGSILKYVLDQTNYRKNSIFNWIKLIGLNKSHNKHQKLKSKSGKSSSLAVFESIIAPIQVEMAFERPLTQCDADINSEDFLFQFWCKIRKEFFPDLNEIDEYQVKWSNRRHTQVLASCNVYRRRVIVASALNAPEYRTILEPLLYHEMCHAVLGKPKIVRGRRVMHGKDFRALERRHPGITLLNQWIKDGHWDRAVKRYY